MAADPPWRVLVVDDEHDVLGQIVEFLTDETVDGFLLPQHVLEDPRITSRVRIPMRPGLRSLNLANAATVALYDLWRQQSYDGGV